MRIWHVHLLFQMFSFEIVYHGIFNRRSTSSEILLLLQSPVAIPVTILPIKISDLRITEQGRPKSCPKDPSSRPYEPLPEAGVDLDLNFLQQLK